MNRLLKPADTDGLISYKDFTQPRDKRSDLFRAAAGHDLEATSTSPPGQKHEYLNQF